MFQVLSAYWFIALGSLLVPVLIHLWNKRPPQIIKVGSIRWLQVAASQQARRLHLRDWPLLLLRCLLLASLVFFLCQPAWRRYHQAGSKKLVLVAPDLLQEPALSLIQNSLDALLQQQYALHRFEPGFPLVPNEDWARIKNGKIKVPTRSVQIPHWALAGQLNAAFPQLKERVIFTSGQISGFSGPRPTLSAATRWVVIPAEKNYTWIQEAFYSGSDSLTAVVGNSAATGTAFIRYRFGLPSANQTWQTKGSPPFRFIRKGKKSWIATGNYPEPVAVKQSPWTVGIYYDPSRSRDAQYVRAALAALATYTGLPVAVTRATAAAQLPPHSNWIFWLSDAALPATIKTKITAGLVLFRDATAAGKSLPAAHFTPAGLPGPIPLLRQVALPSGPAIPNWPDNYGEALLQFQPAGKGGVYYFASRFNRQWNELPESGFFPEVLAGLLLPQADIRHDAREISPEQVQPVLAVTDPAGVPETTTLLDLKYWFIALAAGLFLLERLWSFRKGGMS